MKLRIAFKDVFTGERFSSSETKRAFGGMKVHQGFFKTQADQEGSVVNAVILYDHNGSPAPDAGILSYLSFDDFVEVER